MNTVTVNTTATKNAQLSKIEAMDAEILRLNTLEESIKSQLAQINKSRAIMVEKVKDLPKFLNVEDLEEAFQLIKTIRNIAEHSRSGMENKEEKTQVVNPIIAAPHKNQQGKKLLRRTVAETIDLLKKNEFTTKQISERMGISTSAINIIKKNAGLVKERVGN